MVITPTLSYASGTWTLSKEHERMIRSTQRKMLRLIVQTKTTPQMTRFRDIKLCNNLVTDEIDDHSIQSDYKCTIGLQYPEGKNSTLGIAYAW